MANNFEEQLNHWVKEWHTRLEDMRVQFSLGKMDATDAFEKQKDLLRKTIEHWKMHLDQTINTTEENGKKLKTSLETLMLQLNLGKADGKDLFEEQRKKIEDAMHRVFEDGKKAYENNFEMLMKLYDNNAQAFKTHLEILQLQFALGKMNAKDEAEKIRKELEEKIKELQMQYVDQYKENVEHWNTQMKEGYEKMRSWVNDMIYKAK